MSGAHSLQSFYVCPYWVRRGKVTPSFDWIPSSNPADRNEDPRSCRQPLPRLQQRGGFPHTKRSVPDSPILRTPPAHREDSLPRVRCWVNQIHGVPQLATAAAQGGCLSMGTRKDKADRWERPASLNQSAWDLSRSLGCVGKGLQRTAWEPLRTWDAAAS